MITQQRLVLPPGRPGGIQLLDEGELLWPVIEKIKHGAVNLFLRSPAEAGLSLSVNENCDATVRSDMIGAFERLAPKATLEASAAGAKALLMDYPSLTLPVRNGRISFGTWQGLYLARHSDNGAAEGDLVVTAVPGCMQSGFEFNANKRASHAVESRVLEATAVVERASNPGICLVHEKHTSASLCISRGDLEPVLSQIVPERWNDEFFQHTYEGPDDMPGHVKSTLLGCAASLPLTPDGFGLGPDQSILLNEHRNAGGWGGGHTRKLEVTVLGGEGTHANQTPMEIPLQGSLTDVTDALQQHLATSSIAGPGLLQVFMQDAAFGLLCAEEQACGSWLRAVSAIPGAAGDVAACAALAGPSLIIPICDTGELLLGSSQRVYVCTTDEQRTRDGSEMARLLLTLQGTSKL